MWNSAKGSCITEVPLTATNTMTPERSLGTRVEVQGFLSHCVFEHENHTFS